MADYSLLGSFSTGGASALSGDVLTKLREAEEKSIVTPLETKLEQAEIEVEKILEIKTQVKAFEDVMKFFEIGAQDNVFTQKIMDTTGSSVVFESDDSSTLLDGTRSVHISQLAQKDIYQSNVFTNKESIPTGTDLNDKISIQIGTGTAIDFNTDGKSYQEIATSINLQKGLTASVEKVSDTNYRLIIKSTDSGTSNTLTITQTGLDLGYETDSNSDGVPDNRISTAVNLQAEVDGISYQLSSNTIELSDGLKIKALKVDEVGEVSSLSISKDTSAVIIAVEQMTTQYNTLKDLITTELNDSDSSITDKSSLKTILSNLKSLLFNNYGATTPEWGSKTDDAGDIILNHSNVTNNDKNIFNFGFSLDSQGNLNIDTDKLKDGLEDKMEDLKSLFVGSYENKGLGTLLSETLDSFDGYQGLLYNYDLKMIANKEETEKEKEDIIKTLDIKYQTMAESFSAYGSLITQMESSFSGLKQMIAMETSSN